ncbi:MAG: ATP-dependent DNA helicase RecG [Oscillospiraceae bacterium]|nr:ATP-dependent DNA helicase RecG [Oscillospiraceae bacterium]
MSKADRDIRTLRGIGDSRAKMFGKLGIATLRDLIRFFPRDYQDRTAFRSISQLEDGVVCCVRARTAGPVKTVRIRAGLTISKVPVCDDTGLLTVTFFNRKYTAESIKSGREYVFYGKVTAQYRGFEMQNPDFETAGSSGGSTGAIVPVYRMTAGLGREKLAQAVKMALSECLDEIEEPIPRAVLEEYGLMGAREAYVQIHFPTSWSALRSARERMIFEELFIFSLGLVFMKQRRTVRDGPVISGSCLDEYMDALPFRLTDDQAACVGQALADMGSGRLMSRLIQGDVGSGKTAVAAACAFCVIRSGYQSAMMVPTEILARQHYEKLGPMFEGLGIRTCLLTGSMSASEKGRVRGLMASGEAKLIIGTHALISAQSEYHRLGLVITDEQHRFGVSQRAQLSAKGDAAHVLVMSATPIPRTLALILYGDLDVSVIESLPPGRQPVKTYCVDESYRPRIYEFVRRQVRTGRQVFVVCPAVEDSELMNSVEEYGARLKDEILSNLRVELIHGKMKAQQKESVMADFAAGRSDVLVATTVIEVGMDVPNASVMVVENAERFGLSQLHQLRGRVGRGEAESFCILVCESRNGDAKARMKIMCSTSNGFEIAQEDLRIRGPGDFFGSRQHGLPEFRIADMEYDVRILNNAQKAAAACAERLLSAANGDDPLFKAVSSFFRQEGPVN